MKFLIVTHVRHKQHNGEIYGYGPYIKEMNLWLKYVDEVIVVAPIEEKEPDKIDLAYQHDKLTFIKVPAFNLTSLFEILKTALNLPLISWRIYRQMRQADHIHLRCPGNMGLLGSVLQMAFPRKTKTAKYAGNWDPNSPQPWSYKLQKKILSNTFLTRNMKVLVYGEWPNQSKNIVPFFTATYHESEKEPVKKPSLSVLNLIFVGALRAGKRPLLSVQTAQKLHEEGHEVRLDLFGEGPERHSLEAYIQENRLEKFVVLHGNQSADVVKRYFQKAHFLIFISKSEGWPKVVAEAMFWGCLPITTDVSCVNYMIGGGTRGKIVKPNVDDIIKKVKYYLEHRDDFKEKSKNAMAWSRQFTLEKFEKEIGKFLDEK